MIGDSLLRRLFWVEGRAAECPVIDVHGHMGPVAGIWFPRGSIDEMLHTMDHAGVEWLWFSPHVSLMAPDIGNSIMLETTRRHPNRLRGYMTVNPNYPKAVKQDLDAYDANADLLVGLKFLASYHQCAWDHPGYAPAWEFADERGLIVLCHTWGGNSYCGETQARTAARKYPNCKIILAHSLHNDWDAAVRLATEFPNTYLDLVAVLDDRGPLEMFLRAGLGRKVLFGTDLPWFSPHHGIGAILSADITDEDRHDILHRNARKLLASASDK